MTVGTEDIGAGFLGAYVRGKVMSLVLKSLSGSGKLSLSLACVTVAGFLSGCTTTHTTKRVEPVMVPVAASEVRQPGQSPHQPAPGVVEMAWEEPMVDVVDVPPGLDPEGVYYRPAHRAAIQVRGGRWRYYQPQQLRMNGDGNGTVSRAFSGEVEGSQEPLPVEQTLGDAQQGPSEQLFADPNFGAQ